MRFFEHRPSVQLVIFDLDGTLIDSKADLANSVNATLHHLGRPPLDQETIYSYVGRGAPALIAQALGEGMAPSEVERGLQFFLAYYSEHKLDSTTVYPGTREALKKLANGTKDPPRMMAVLSNKPVRASREILDGLGLLSLFRVVYGGNSFEFKKPDPIGLFKILEESGVPNSAAMMVGDSDVDIMTGLNAGVWTCGVTHGFGTLNLKENPPDLVVDSLPELADLLE
jgi:phosphoglycolate phosphatase